VGIWLQIGSASLLNCENQKSVPVDCIHIHSSLIRSLAYSYPIYTPIPLYPIDLLCLFFSYISKYTPNKDRIDSTIYHIPYQYTLFPLFNHDHTTWTTIESPSLFWTSYCPPPKPHLPRYPPLQDIFPATTAIAIPNATSISACPPWSPTVTNQLLWYISEDPSSKCWQQRRTCCVK